MKKVLGVVFLLGCVFCAQFGLWWLRAGKYTQPQTVEIPAGASAQQIARLLKASGVIDSVTFFYWGSRLQGVSHGMQAGKYRFALGLTPLQILQQVVTGEVYAEVVFEITIPEGESTKWVYPRIAADLGVSLQQVQQATMQVRLPDVWAVPRASLEGFLYPAKYTFFDRMPSPEQVLQKMVDTFATKLPEGYVQQCAQHQLTVAQAVAFASLIEKETDLAVERSLVAEVIWNRLRRGEPLGIDAAVIYGVEDFDGNLTRAHLRDRANPYNSRRHKGLPPTPIASPSHESLLAVFTPTNHGYNYYVLKAGGQGEHVFSRTLQEHNRAVRALVKYSRSKH
ncbi:MAG: endolytic transglycosylase MltG [Zetaproteobacteria bacterium]|nr:endolytic transglycosylase MltG [Zetaproteobacteria bacterium]